MLRYEDGRGSEISSLPNKYDSQYGNEPVSYPINDIFIDMEQWYCGSQDVKVTAYKRTSTLEADYSFETAHHW